jgi:hypothetical protein
MAQELFLPPAGSPVSLSAPGSPLLLRGMKVDAKDPLRMDFLVDRGRASVSDESFDDESLRLIKYFLASLTIPEKDLWVNLSPYENERIIQDDFGRTGMGRDLLAQDYILKQLTAGLLHPDGATGKVFWAEVYRRAYDRFGTTDIPVDTFNKVWIVPAKSVVYESRSPDGKKISAFVKEMKLDVMLETDYLATSNNPLSAKAPEGANLTTSALAKDILREVVIPVLEKEVNEGANFSLLRQVCYSLILSVWLKKKLMASAEEAAQGDPRTGNILSRIFINRHKTQGIEILDPKVQTKLIYDRYVEAFKRGAYDLIKEEVDVYSQELIPRKYFSGGFDPSQVSTLMEMRQGVVPDAQGDFSQISAEFRPEEEWDQNRPSRVYTWDLRPWYRQPRKLLIAGLVAVAVTTGIWGVSRMFQGAGERKIEISIRNRVTSDDILSTLETLGDNYKLFEDARSGFNTPSYSSEQLLKRMTGKSVSSGSVKIVAETFQKYFDDLCPNISALGVHPKDIFEEASSIMLIESNFYQTRVQNDARKAAPGFGLFQFEPNTMRYLFKTEKFLSFINDKHKYLLPDGRDLRSLMRQLFNNRSKIMNKGNTWNVAEVKKSPMMYWDVQVALALMFWEDMVTKEFTPPEDGFFIQSGYVFEKYDITLPLSVQNRIVGRLTMAESYEKLVKKHRDLTSTQIFQLMLAASHKAGGPRSFEDYDKMINYFKKDKDGRIADHKGAIKTRKEAVRARDDSWKQMAKFLASLKGEKKIGFVIEWMKDIDDMHPVALGRVLEKLQDYPEDRKKFLNLYFQYAESFSRLRQAQRAEGSLAPYVDISYFLINNQDLEGSPIGEDLRELYKAADKSQVTVNGGIDLSAQESAMDVFGRSGTFNLDLSPEQMKMLDQDVRGFLPIIINVQPVRDVKMFLGFTNGTSPEETGGPSLRSG